MGQLLNKRRYGNMVCLKGTEMTYVHLENVIGYPKMVDPIGELVNAAKSIGTSFGN